MASHVNNVLFTAVSSGTGDFVVSAAVTGYQTPALAGATSGATYRYHAESADKTEWEIGYGTYTSGSTTLARTTVLYNSAGTGTASGQSGAGSKISFTAAPRVAIVAIKEDWIGVDEANSFTATQQAQARANLAIGAADFTNRVINPSGVINQRNAVGSGTITVTIASPAVVTWTSHGLPVGAKISFSTTGALPTGITAGTSYYIIATSYGANSFQISTSFGGSAVNTSGSQSGTHTGYAAYADGDYSFDRWVTLSQSAPITASQVTAAEDGTPYMMRFTQPNGTAQRYGVLQPIEYTNIADLRGKTVTLSARVRMSASTTLRYALVEWTGTADSPTKDVVNDWTSATYTTSNFFIGTTTTIAGTGSTSLTANTLTTVSLSAALSSSANNVSVFFWTDSTQAQNVTLDVGLVQLENGAAATPHAFRSRGHEALLCQRYYYRQNSTATTYTIAIMQCNSTTTAFGKILTLPTTMRTTPSALFSSVSHFGLCQADGTGVALTSGTVTRPYVDHLSANALTVASGLVAGNATMLYSSSTAGWIDANAEL